MGEKMDSICLKNLKPPPSPNANRIMIEKLIGEWTFSKHSLLKKPEKTSIVSCWAAGGCSKDPDGLPQSGGPISQPPCRQTATRQSLQMLCSYFYALLCNTQPSREDMMGHSETWATLSLFLKNGDTTDEFEVQK